MSEQGGDRIQAEDVREASVDQTDTVDLSSGLKDDGYPPGSIPAAQEHNWLFWKRYLQTLNLYAGVPRIFDTLGEALDQIGVSPPDVPIVLGERFAVDGLMAGGSTVFKLGDIGKDETLGNPIVDMACDGQKIYVAIGQTISGRRNLGSLATEWAKTPDAPNLVLALESDGLNVYAAFFSSDDVYLLDPTDGSTNAVIADATTTISDLAANGEHLLVAERTGQVVSVYDTLGGTPAFVGVTAGHGADVEAVALDHDQGYLTGDLSSGIAVRAFALTSPGSFLWSVTLPGITGGGLDIKADGAFVYVVTDQGDGNVSAWCLCRADGCIVWGGIVAEGKNLERCAVDHRHLWVSDEDEGLYVLDKSSGVEVFRVANQIVKCADGHQAFAFTPSSGGNYKGRRCAEHRVFTVVAGTDPDRRPFPRISIPGGEPPLGAQAQINVFGDEYQTAEETTADNEPTTTPKQFLRLTTPASLPAGTYEIGWYYVWRHTNLTTDFAARVQVDDTTHLIDPGGNNMHRQEPTDVAATQRIVSSGFATLPLTAGAHDIDIDFWSATGTGIAHMAHARLRLMRVS